jgi:hypothetical protein
MLKNCELRFSNGRFYFHLHYQIENLVGAKLTCISSRDNIVHSIERVKHTAILKTYSLTEHRNIASLRTVAVSAWT